MTKALVVACAYLTLGSACESVTEVGLKVILPEDHSDLDTVDNLLLVLEPDGISESVSIDGLDFSVELELPADAALRANLFLARGSELKAWGRTTTFLSSSAPGLALFLGRPGMLSTFPGTLDDPDPQLLAAALPGRGLFMLDSEGDTFLLSEFSYLVSAGETLDDAPSPNFGGMYTVQEGVLRLAWGPSPRAARFDSEASTWTDLEFTPPTDLEFDAPTPSAPNPGASVSEFFVYGETQSWRVDLIDLDDPDAAAIEVGLGATHDGARPGASALGLDLGEAPTQYLVFGAPDDRAVFWTEDAEAFGPTGPWIGGACAQVDPGVAQTQVLCVGGSRDGSPSADLLLLARASDGSWAVEELPQALPTALADPLWLVDETALYAQSDGQVVRIARDSLLPDAEVSSAQRFAQGHSVELPTGATFLVGGLGNEGQPLTRWQVFMPAFETPSEAP